MDKNKHILKAVSALGGQTATAKILDANDYRVVQAWILSGQVPAKYCPRFEKLSGVSRYKLRPKDGLDIWPREERRSHV